MSSTCSTLGFWLQHTKQHSLQPRYAMFSGMRGVLLTVLPVLLANCHTGYDPSWERTVSPAGRPAFILECSRTAWCIELAGDLCPRGYSVLSTGTEGDYDPANQVVENTAAAATGRWPANMGRSVRYAAIECRSQDSPSLPPKVTVTRNAPPTPTPKRVATDSGLED